MAEHAKGITANMLQTELAKSFNEKRARRVWVKDNATGAEYVITEIVKNDDDTQNRLLLLFDSSKTGE